MPCGIEAAVYVAASGDVPVSPLVSRSPFGAKIFTTMSSAELAIAAVATICLVWSSVSSKECFGPQSVALISPLKGKTSLELSTWFCRWSTRPVTASIISV